MTVIFACRRNRLRDIGLIRLGIVSAGHKLRVVVIPWGFPTLCLFAVFRLLGQRMHLIVSDKCFGDTFVAWLFGTGSTRMMWNYADEFPADAITVPHHRVCFFREAEFDIDVFRFAPQPAAPTNLRREPLSRPILFLGDVTTELPSLKEIAQWHSHFHDLLEAFGFTFYLRPEYESAIEEQLISNAEQRAARVLAKNLLRLWVVKSVRRHFGERLILVGSNWRKFGLSAEASVYDWNARVLFYQSAIVNLDCGSKSGDDALYPRSSEVVSFAGGLLQVACADSATIFGERWSEFSFGTEYELLGLLEERLVESASRRRERDAWLIHRLQQSKFLMQHSVERLLRFAGLAQ
jgi:hypothetical protein